MIDFLDRFPLELPEEIANLAARAMIKTMQVNHSMQQLVNFDVPGQIYPKLWYEDETK